jgi:DNA-binding response OmpR family regulator
MKKALVIEDDKNIAGLLEMMFEELQMEMVWVNNGIEGLERALSEEFDCIILDLSLPGMNGIDVCRGIRAKKQITPIVMVTSKSSEIDKVLGIEMGADDYVTKPFSPRELGARIAGIMRRFTAFKEASVTGASGKKLSAGELEIDFDGRTVTRAGKLIDLTALEFELLQFLAKEPGKAFSRDVLLTKVWGYEYAGLDQTVNSHVNRLRSKVEKDSANPEYILTVRGFGYKFTDELQ